jgi:hypothetical protein
MFTTAQLIGAARAALLTLGALGVSACAGARGPEATQPHANEPPYPILLTADAQRREQSLATWQALMQTENLTAAPTPTLEPVTATVSALPAGVTLTLPKVEIASNAATTRDEATREALRRFMTNAAPLLGVTAKDLSLVETRDGPAGGKLARYQQNPFAHPLRGGFGLIEIGVGADGRVNSLSSTAITDTERLARAIAAQPQKLTAQDAEQRLAGRAFSYTLAGANSTYTVSPSDQLKARDLVVYPLRRANDPAVLELHLAWEVAVTRGVGPPLLAYVDAVTGDTIAAEPQPTTRAK